jgi:hypothetical protein
MSHQGETGSLLLSEDQAENEKEVGNHEGKSCGSRAGWGGSSLPSFPETECSMSCFYLRTEKV